MPKPTPEPRLSKAELAERLGVQTFTLDRWCREGCPYLHPAGGKRGPREFLLSRVKAWMSALGRTGAMGRPKDTDRAAGLEAVNSAPAPSHAGTGAEGATAPAPAPGAARPASLEEQLLRAKLRKETALAAKNELEYERARGALVPLEDVQKERLQRIAVVKARLLATPGKLAQRCAGKDAREVERQLKDEMTAILAEFAGGSTGSEAPSGAGGGA